MNFFEDIERRRPRELGSHTFTAERSRRSRRNTIRSRSMSMKRRPSARISARSVASGWHTAAVCMRLHRRCQNQREDARLRGSRRAGRRKSGPSPGVRDMRWLKPVYPGDTITFASEIDELRAALAARDIGLVVTRTTGTNQHGELVYSAQGAVFVERRHRSHPTNRSCRILRFGRPCSIAFG